MMVRVSRILRSVWSPMCFHVVITRFSAGSLSVRWRAWVWYLRSRPLSSYIARYYGLRWESLT
jgi:hypothetical protein